MQDLVKYEPIKAMIEGYEKAKQEVEEGFRLLASAKQRMCAFGTCRGYIFNGRIPDYSLLDEIERSHEYMKEQAWRGIVEKARLRNLMSEKRNRELDGQLDSPEKLPELTFENITAMLEHFASNIDTLLTETISETFNFLRPRGSRYKTNTEFEIKEKVIITGAFDFDPGYGYTRISTYRENNFRAMDNVFHLLDGKGPVKYPGDLLTAIHSALEKCPQAQECETEYFHLKWYKNGNCHIRFKRMDLVAELNRRGGGNAIKPG